MSLTNFTATVLTRYKADTTDAKAKVKDLQGVQREHAKAHLQSLEEQNKGLERHIAGVAKIGVAIGAVTGAVMVAKKAWGAYVEDATLRANLHEHDIEKLQKAAGGLISKYDLMKLAVSDNNGAWNLSQREMETVALAMRSLTKQGNDAKMVFTEIQKALTEGTVEPLKKFGIVLEGLKGPQEKQIAFMQAMRDQANAFGGDMTNVNDQTRKSMVDMEDSWREMTVAVGQMIDSLAPMIIGLTKLVGGLADGLTWVGKNLQGDYSEGEKEVGLGVMDSARMGVLGAKMAQRNARFNAANDAYLAQPEVRQNLARAEEAGKKIIAMVGGSLNSGIEAGLDAAKMFEKAKKKKGGKGSKSGGTYTGISGAGGMYGEDVAFADTAWSMGEGIGTGLGGLPEEWDRLSTIREAATKETERRDSMLVGMFGPLEEFNLYAEGFNLLSGATQTAFDAWVSGSASATQAMKSFVKAGLAGIASTMFAESIKHAAYAIGMLAFPSLESKLSAAQHAKAALAFGAGAAVVGGISRAMSGGGAAVSGSVSGGGSGAGVRGIGSSGPQNSNATIVIGDDFADDSPRNRARKIARAVDVANRTVGERSVRFS